MEATVAAIEPGRLAGTAAVPPSKSAAHRAVVCAALAAGTSHIGNVEFSQDILATLGAAQQLGAKVERGEHELTITGRGNADGFATITRPVFCNESGSTLRFLLPVLGALGVQAEIQMHGRLPERPLSPLWEVLEAHGMQLQQDGAVLHTAGQLCTGDYSLPGNVSSQFISGLLFALPLLNGNSTLTVTGALQSARYVAMTEQALAEAGILTKKDGPVWQIGGGQRYAAPAVQTVEGDWSNTAFFLCMGALSKEGVTVEGLNLHSSQGDRGVLDVLRRFGAEVTEHGDAVTVRRGTLHGVMIDAAPIPDLIPVLSVVASVAEGKTRVENAYRLRLKESDRLKSTANLLRALGGRVEEKEDGLVITGVPALHGGSVETQNDHRLAMSAATAACAATGEITVDNDGCVAKSYPRFWEDFGSLKGEGL